MKIPGFLLLLAGWGLTLAAIVLLPQPAARGVFMIMGMLVELLGVGLVARAQFLEREITQ